MQPISGGDVAVEFCGSLRRIDRGDRAHEYFAVELDAEAVALHPRRQRVRRALKVPAQRGDDAGRREFVDLDHLRDGTLDQVRMRHQEALAGLAQIVGLENAETLARRHAHEHDDGDVVDHGRAVEQPAVLEIELAAGGAADEQTGEAAVKVHRLHQEAFAGREAIDECQRQRFARADREGGPDFGERFAHQFDPRVGAALRMAAADVGAEQRHRVGGHLRDQRR